jgi:hypothetical protein
LTGWRDGEASERLNDAVRLLDAAFVERDSGGQEWQDSVRRAAELLEWLSLPLLTPHNVPLRLLSAAAYQIAGYPARSTGLLHKTEYLNAESKILANFLRADFPNLLSSLTEYWGSNFASPALEVRSLDQGDSDTFSENFHREIVAETASALGILCAAFR